MQGAPGGAMKPFDYMVPATVEEACVILSELGGNARVLAGGTDLLIEWRRPASAPPGVVADISRIALLKGISLDDGLVTVRPLTTHTELLQSDIVRSAAPFLAAAAATIGSPQIRNRGTVGGNIMNAAACADTVPPLVALEATVTLQSLHGTRTMKLADLFIEPYHTKAGADEVLTGIEFAQLPARTRSAFIKLGRRNALAISRLSVAAVLATDGSGRITEARIVPGAAFPVWQRVSEAEQMLLGERPSATLFGHAGKKVADMMITRTGRRWSTEYKEPVIAVLVKRALEACT